MNGELGRVVSTVPPGAGAAVMGTAILSTGMAGVPVRWLSYVLVVIAAVLWLALAVLFLNRLLVHRARWVADADVPASLTGVAGTCVLATRLSMLGWLPVAAAMLALSAALWLVLLPLVLAHWQKPTVGANFLLCVSTQGLVVLAASIGAAEQLRWLAVVAGVLFVAGLVAYAGVLVTFDFRQVARGAGDHWVAGGALAISTLAATKLYLAAGLLGVPGGALRVAALVLWALAVGWYLVLAVAEAVWRRPRYDVRRWSTVFPLGMTATACINLGMAAHLPAIRTAGQVLIWPALAVWAAVAYGAANRLRSAALDVRGTP
ncbi:membrane protein [Actinocatenispora thailandica]|uniref:Membrane protein n=1 Tax=Actinocatenispora thailandica TaxID=227318 RepID=A0A7R7DL93_9ACTN|nr:tellurite resistance/C4-dicarboxylate transporter family protein [Actinocatenispora thailandica]BCJ33556.1 membrane protein [Actinocatenispora thailandica]